ncbi:unnamed protein product, partial [Ectocarpus fasciculatus]
FAGEQSLPVAPRAPLRRHRGVVRHQTAREGSQAHGRGGDQGSVPQPRDRSERLEARDHHRRKVDDLQADGRGHDQRHPRSHQGLGRGERRVHRGRHGARIAHRGRPRGGGVRQKVRRDQRDPPRGILPLQRRSQAPCQQLRHQGSADRRDREAQQGLRALHRGGPLPGHQVPLLGGGGCLRRRAGVRPEGRRRSGETYPPGVHRQQGGLGSCSQGDRDHVRSSGVVEIKASAGDARG